MLCTAVPAFSDNYIWLIHQEEGREAVVVDPGDAAPVKRALAERGLELTGILATHHHPDHVGGVAELLRDCIVPVYGPAGSPATCISTPLREGDTVSVLGQNFQVLAVPGHTLDHIAFYLPGNTPLLFCGDTLFAGGCGRLFEGTAQMMHESLAKLATLPAHTRVYCAHEYTLANLHFARAVEPDNARLQQRIDDDQSCRDRNQPTVPSELSLELQTNPFLRCEEASINAAAARHAGQPLLPGVDTFAAVRAWKDSF